MKKSSRIVAKDKRFISPSYTRTYPLVIDRGEGVYLWDVDGKKYLDFSSGVAVTNIGHGNPEVVKAIKNQAEKIIHKACTDFYCENMVELAEKLFGITPGNFAKRVFFTNSGTESVECAFKLARWHAKKPGMISFVGSFHGRTFGSMSLSGGKSVHKEYFAPVVPGVNHIPFPNPYRPEFGDSKTCGDGVLSYLENLLKKTITEDEVTGVIVEPIQGESGYVVPPMDFHRKLQKFCRERGFLYIVDEVQTGFARSGKWFASDVFGVEPDIICVAKAIGAGIPMGACISRKEIMNWPRGAHASTFAGNALAVAASMASIEFIKKKKLWLNAEKLGKFGLKYLKDLQDEVRLIGDVRGLGLMIAVELVKDRKTKAPAKKEAELVLNRAFKKGLVLLHAGESCVRIVPPLIITKEEFEKGLEILAGVLRGI